MDLTKKTIPPVTINVKPLRLFWPRAKDKMTHKMQVREARTHVIRAVNAWFYGDAE